MTIEDLNGLIKIMILKNMLKENINNEKLPKSLIILDKLIEAASFIDDKCLSLGKLLRLGHFKVG